MADPKEALGTLLKALNTADRKIKNILKDPKLVTQVSEVLKEANITESSKLDEETLDLYFELAFKVSAETPKNRSFLLKYLVDGKLGPVQLAESIKYLKKVKEDGAIDVNDYEKTCGIGVVVTEEEIRKAILEILEEKKAEFGDDPKKKIGPMWKYLKERLPFHNPSDAKKVLDSILNPPKEDHTRVDFQEPEAGWAPKDNKQVRPELLEQHLKETGGIVITRFPPEPNGYLHIGHAKAMQLDFGYAKAKGGVCIMRFDDTNPETESPEYVNSILDNVKWMGHEYVRVTYASDYFDRLYEDAKLLIKKGLAYVCHQTPAEIEEYRSQHKDSPWRDRPIEENLRLFEDMKHGKFAEGAATLRMKMDMKSTNSVMWDLVAYRIKYIPHHRTGDKWCIYPSYDFTHCLCDSYENITHSLCTLEFAMRRESYNWLVDAVGLYKARVWEMARLNLTHTMLSKRKLIHLVKEKIVRGWDDPRMPTIQGYRRKGMSPDGINAFCKDIGVTRNASVIPIEKLEEFVRQDLNANSRRIFAVYDPIKLTIKNWTKGVIDVEIPNVPNKPEKGSHKIPFSSTLIIERTDYREVDEPDYFGLALKTKDDKPKVVKLKYVNVDIKLVDIVKDASGKATELIVEAVEGFETKHAIHWIAIVDGKMPTKIEVREYDHLFMSEEPAKFEGNWLDDLNPNSEIVREAHIDPSYVDLKVLDRVQFERLGYYCVDPDTKPGHMVFNRTMALKESSWKKQQKPKK